MFQPPMKFFASKKALQKYNCKHFKNTPLLGVLTGVGSN